MKCSDCGHKVVSSGLVYCPKCSAALSEHARRGKRFPADREFSLIRLTAL